MKHKPNKLDVHVVTTSWEETGSEIIGKVPIERCSCETYWDMLERLAKAAAEEIKENNDQK